MRSYDCEPPQQRHGDQLAGAARDADDDASAGLLRLVANGLPSVFRLLEQRYRVPVQDLARGREPDAVPAPVEHPDAKLRLEVRDLLGQRGLRDVQGFGRAGHVPDVGDAGEVPQLLQIHAGRPSVNERMFLTKSDRRISLSYFLLIANRHRLGFATAPPTGLT